MEAKPKRDRRSTVRAQNSTGLQPKATTAKPGKNDRSQPKPPAMPLLVAGKEVLGRELTVLREGPKTAVWLPGCVKAFNEPEVLHQIVYNLPFPDAVKSTDEFEPAEWLCLAKHHFVWNDKQAWTSHLANPTYSQQYTPKGTSAIGQRVRVLWPSMRKWYTGKVLEYDSSTDQHKVLFTDGDRKTYRIPHEPVVWLDIPQLACEAAIQKTRAEEGDVPIPVPVISNDENKPPETSSLIGQEVNGRERLKARKDKKEVVSNGRKIMRTRTQAASSDMNKNGSAKASKGSQVNKAQGAKAPGVKKADEPRKGAVSRPVDKSTAAGAQTEVAKPVPKSPQSSPPKSPDSRKSLRATKASPAKADCTAQKAVLSKPASAGVSKTVPEAATKPSAAQPAQKPSSATPAGDGKEVAVSVKVECSSKKKQCEVLQGAFNNLMRASPVHSRKRNRVQEAVNLASKTSDAGQPAKARALSKLSTRPSLKARPSLNGRRDSQLQQSMDSIKGSRVGVWWEADNCYYKGTVIACDGYHRNITVRYDDNIKEKSRIDSLQFKWLLPKARSAGATDKVHAAFHTLGAMNVTNPVDSGPVVDVPVKMETREPDKGLHPSRPSPESPAEKCLPPMSVQTAPANVETQAPAANGGPASPSHISNSAFTPAATNFQPLSQAQTSPMMLMARHMPSLATLPGLGAAHLLTTGQNLASLMPTTSGSTSAAGLLPVIQAAAQHVSLMGLTSSSQAQALPNGQAAPMPAALQAAFSPAPAPCVSPAGAASYRKPHPEADNADAKPSQATAVNIPQGPAAEGWRVSIKFRGNGEVYEGLVLRCDTKTGKCHVLWEDGEDEWLDANDQDLTWVTDRKKRPGESKKLPSYSAGLAKGLTAPSNEDLVGWRIAVYWPSDGKFYEGTVDSCDTELTQHKILYCDGEERFEELSEEVFKYILPPNVNPVGHSMRGRMEDTDAEDGTLHRRPRKKLRAANPEEDSDDEPALVVGRSLKQIGSNLNLRVSLGAKDKGIQRMMSGRGSLLLFDRDQAGGGSPFCSPMSPQGSQAFALHGQCSSRQDSRNPPAVVKNIPGLISSDGFRVGVKRVRIFLNDADNAKSARSSKLSKGPPEGDMIDAVHKPAGAVVAVNNLHQEPARYQIETLRAIRDRVEIATDNIRNSMPLASESLSDVPSLPSSVPSGQNLLRNTNSRGVLETQPPANSQSVPAKPPSNAAPSSPTNAPVAVLEEKPDSSEEAVLLVEKSRSGASPRLSQLSSDVLLASSNPVIPENLTPPPSPFSGFKEESTAPGELCPELVSTLADGFAQENHNSMALPQTPSVNFEAMIRAPSRTGSMGSNHNHSPGRVEPDCRPPLDSQKESPELVRSH